ncbi:MAG: hypothetical protein ACREJC_09215 [Tepidisphaeraceae bacterium]
MGRRVFAIFAFVSLLICLATAGVVVRSWFALDRWDFGGRTWEVTFACLERSVICEICTGLQDGQRPFEYFEIVRISPPEDRRLKWWHDEPGFCAVKVPHWLIFLVFLPWPIWWLGVKVARRRRFAHGCCVECGYDLRATPDRCPECGTAIGVKN